MLSIYEVRKYVNLYWLHKIYIKQSTLATHYAAVIMAVEHLHLILISTALAWKNYCVFQCSEHLQFQDFVCLVCFKASFCSSVTIFNGLVGKLCFCMTHVLFRGR